MRTLIKISQFAVSLFLLCAMVNPGYASSPGLFSKHGKQDTASYITYLGRVVDNESMQPLVFATINVEGTNIATVTNTEGRFNLKIPKDSPTKNIVVSFIGYENLVEPIANLQTNKNNLLKVKMVSVKLTEISVFPNDPRILINKVIESKNSNYSNEPLIMTAFYRETIKKRWAYVSISEAVVEVYKQSYNGFKQDLVRLFKGRKSTNVEKVDTLLFKLQGGPYSTLMLDIMKDPYLILSNDVLNMYDYSYQNITRIDGRLNYVIEFKQKPYVSDPLFYGRFYIDVDTYAISSIVFDLNTENREEASSMFIKKKPFGVSVYPTVAHYMVNYREKDGKWFYSYSRGEVNFKVNWKKKLFSSNYSTTVEMAITDWDKAGDKPFKPSDRLKMNVVMSDAVSGFADEDFWGKYNTIEPEQSIEAAIRKIKRQLDKKE